MPFSKSPVTDACQADDVSENLTDCWSHCLTPELRERLRSFILSRVRDYHLADDLTQEIFLKVGRTLQPQKIQNIDAWLFSIARNTVADHFRSSRDFVQWQSELHGGVAEESVLPVEETELCVELTAYVRTVVENLRPVHREVLRLSDYENYTQKEIAWQLGVSLTCVKSRVRRARAEVRHFIELCCRIATDAYGQVVECERLNRSLRSPEML